jgi:hypothetical protein
MRPVLASWALAAIVFCGQSVAHASAVPATLEPIAGGGQIGVIGSPFPGTIQARVLGTDGLPVSGATVYFEVDQCISFDSSNCPPQDTYPTFPGGSFSTSSVTDTNGIASAPVLTAGSSESIFSVVATLYVDGAGGGILGQVFFPLEQVASLDAVSISPAFTGAWYDPAQSGHGLMIEVLPENRFLAYWFAFTPGGSQQAWFGGVGVILHNNQAIINAAQGQGGAWIPNFDPSHFSLQRWGTLTFTFTDCNHGRVDFFGDGDSSPWLNGSMELTRLTMPEGLTCN